jgi:hypothetical protein
LFFSLEGPQVIDAALSFLHSLYRETTAFYDPNNCRRSSKSNYCEEDIIAGPSSTILFSEVPFHCKERVYVIETALSDYVIRSQVGALAVFISYIANGTQKAIESHFMSASEMDVERVISTVFLLFSTRYLSIGSEEVKEYLETNDIHSPADTGAIDCRQNAVYLVSFLDLIAFMKRPSDHVRLFHILSRTSYHWLCYAYFTLSRFIDI